MVQPLLLVCGYHLAACEMGREPLVEINCLADVSNRTTVLMQAVDVDPSAEQLAKEKNQKIEWPIPFGLEPVVDSVLNYLV